MIRWTGEPDRSAAGSDDSVFSVVGESTCSVLTFAAWRLRFAHGYLKARRSKYAFQITANQEQDVVSTPSASSMA